MKTKLYRLNKNQIKDETIKIAAACIKNGGLVAFPTETVYGLGANAFDSNAVKKIFIAKKRPANDPLIVHIHSFNNLKAIAIDIPQIAWDLAENFWPGPLTLILKKNSNIPSIVSSGIDTVAVRIPDHKIALSLLEKSQLPIAAPSANLFSKPSPTTAQHVLDDLENHVDIVLDGGASNIGIESTVLDLTQNEPQVLRPGGIRIEALQKIIPSVKIASKYLSERNKDLVYSPGMLLKHYSPNARLILFEKKDKNDESEKHVIEKMQDFMDDNIDKGQKVGILTTHEEISFFKNSKAYIMSLGSVLDLKGIANMLFSTIRELDKKNVDYILVKSFPLKGLGLAIQDRLIRAAEGKIIRV